MNHCPSVRAVTASLVLALGIAAGPDLAAAQPTENAVPFFQEPFPVVAHRGGAGLAPENTLYAFRKVVEANPSAVLQTDVRLSADGNVVLIHDETIDRTTDGNGVVGIFTLAELGEVDAGHSFSTDGGETFPRRGEGLRIPTLTEVLIALPNTRFQIELKEGAKLLSATLDAIRQQVAQDRVLLSSTNAAVLERVRTRAPGIATCLHEEAVVAAVNRLRTEKNGTTPHAGAVLCISTQDLERFEVRSSEILAFAAGGLPVQVHTVNDSELMESLLDRGVASIMTDRPDRLLRVVAGREPQGQEGPAAPAAPLSPFPVDVGALVVLGDSISDPPNPRQKSYHLLAFANLQGWRGKEIDYRVASRAGSRGRDLHGQIRSLPAKLDSPVIVFMTIGGNDMRDSAPLIVMNAASAKREELHENISRAIDTLLAPGRFGEDVEVRVYATNIYDPTDGRGNFQVIGCPTPIQVPDSDPMFGRWNREVERAITDRGQKVIDLYGHFYGHGVGMQGSWYERDCLHPSEDGHVELGNLFFEAVTGEKPPEGGLAADLAMPIGRGLHEGAWVFTLRSGQTFRGYNYYDLGDTISVTRMGIEVKFKKSEIESIKPTR